MIKMNRAIVVLVALWPAWAFAVDIEGVQPAAMDQPRVNMHLRRDRNGKALAVTEGKERTIHIQAFLDTGASGVMLSGKTADALGVKRASTSAAGKLQPTTFHDIGVGGGDTFAVSEKLFIFVAPYKSSSEPADETDYPVAVGPFRTQISSGGGLIEMLTGGLDVLGMPAIKGHIVIIDPKPTDTFSDMMRTGLFDRASAKIPQLSHHVKLTYVDFKRFTHMDPPTAEFPALAANPMIGPDPLAAVSNTVRTPRVVATFGGNKVEGTWLLDTGAAASMISVANAEKLGVKYVEGTQGTNSPKLSGIPADKQFTISVGGVGGTKKSAGFFLDSLTIPTRENDPLVYKPAPVLVNDITVEDPKTKQTITLDGVFGMNYLAASAFVTESATLPDINHMTAGPYEWIVIDEPAGMLGLKVKKQP